LLEESKKYDLLLTKEEQESRCCRVSLADWLAGWLADWLDDWLTDWLVGWLAGYLTG